MRLPKTRILINITTLHNLKNIFSWYQSRREFSFHPVPSKSLFFIKILYYRNTVPRKPCARKFDRWFHQNFIYTCNTNKKYKKHNLNRRFWSSRSQWSQQRRIWKKKDIIMTIDDIIRSHGSSNFVKIFKLITIYCVILNAQIFLLVDLFRDVWLAKKWLHVKNHVVRPGSRQNIVDVPI